MHVRSPYIPILSGRAGEMDALREAQIAAADAVTPLFDLAPVRRALPTGDGPVKVTDPAHALNVLLSRVETVWGTSRRFFINVEGYAKFHRPGGVHAVEFLAREVQKRGLRASLVVSSSAGPEYHEEARVNVAAWNGYAVRLCQLDGQDDSDGLALAASLQVSSTVTDLILDLGRVDNVDRALLRLDGVAGAADFRKRWSSVALASTALPDWSAIKQPVDGKSFRRVDRAVWLRLRDELGSALAYSDFGITGPRVDTDEPVSGPAPHLRYTERDDFWIWRGQKPQEGGDRPGIPYAELCDSLERIRNRRGRSVYRGGAFSWGDGRIADAMRSRAAGTPRTWIANSTSHHLRQIEQELSS